MVKGWGLVFLTSAMGFMQTEVNYQPGTKKKSSRNIISFDEHKKKFIINFKLLSHIIFCFENTHTQLTGICFKYLFHMANHIEYV